MPSSKQGCLRSPFQTSAGRSGNPKDAFLGATDFFLVPMKEDPPSSCLALER